jgi:hypothetical protein
LSTIACRILCVPVQGTPEPRSMKKKVAHGSALSRIHRIASNRNSPKFISKILQSLTPVPLKTPPPSTLHSPVPIPLVTPMDRYARSRMFFLQTNICVSERTPYAMSLMLQVAGRSYADLLRNPNMRTSENSVSANFAQYLFHRLDAKRNPARRLSILTQLSLP